MQMGKSEIYTCKLCNKPHNAKDFSVKSREESLYENDTRIRQFVLSKCYKRQEDFQNEDEYDDYLEKIEDFSK